MTKLVKAKQ